MRYDVKWKERPQVSEDLFRTLANGHLTLETEDGVLILHEEYVPLVDLAEELKSWGLDGRFDYCPEGYSENPMLSFSELGGEFVISTPDTRDNCVIIKIAKEELKEFCVRFHDDVVSSFQP